MDECEKMSLQHLPPQLKLKILGNLAPSSTSSPPSHTSSASTSSSQPNPSRTSTTSTPSLSTFFSPPNYTPPPSLFGDLSSLVDVESEEKHALSDDNSNKKGFLLSADDLRQLSREGFIVRDNFLGEETCSNVHKHICQYVSEGKLSKSGMKRCKAKWGESSIRGDYIKWIHPDDQTIPERIVYVWKKMDEIRHHLNQITEFNSQKIQIQLAHYPGDGARYIRHVDAFPDGPSRRLTLLYYTNIDWQSDHGGQLRVYIPQNTTNESTEMRGEQTNSVSELVKDIEPIGDRLVIFLSEWIPHEVLPARHSRYALTTWFY